jgi:hypothetical protein
MFKLNLLKPELCRYCRQDLLRECTPELRAAAGQPCPIGTIARLSRTAEEVGLSYQNILELLEHGMTVQEVARMVLSRLTPGPISA